VTTHAQRASKEELAELGSTLAKVTDALLDRGLELAQAVQLFEVRFLRSAMDRHSGNLSQAASALGIHRNTLRTKLQRNGLPARKNRVSS
jgi:DNA-binding NtrC family response regulator